MACWLSQFLYNLNKTILSKRIQNGRVASPWSTSVDLNRKKSIISDTQRNSDSKWCWSGNVKWQSSYMVEQTCRQCGPFWGSFRRNPWCCLSRSNIPGRRARTSSDEDLDKRTAPGLYRHISGHTYRWATRGYVVKRMKRYLYFFLWYISCLCLDSIVLRIYAYENTTCFFCHFQRKTCFANSCLPFIVRNPPKRGLRPPG